jgi:hypothetical protein
MASISRKTWSSSQRNICIKKSLSFEREFYFFWCEKHGTSRSPPRAGSPRARNAFGHFSEEPLGFKSHTKNPSLSKGNFIFSGAQDGTWTHTPEGIRTSNVRVYHSTTWAFTDWPREYGTCTPLECRPFHGLVLGGMAPTYSLALIVFAHLPIPHLDNLTETMRILWCTQ